MTSCGQSITNKNVTLSQSYSQGVERIRKQMNKILPLELPKQILIQREHAWDKLFEKYSENISNDIELNIQDSDSDSKKNGTNDGDNDNDEDENEYFSKCRIPMRKHPALVQYWVDTGNPPYQLVDDNSSLTGSSLSEVENSRSSLLIVNQCSNVENKNDNTTSVYSSVDTVAYILSNTNVTKKSETVAIIEGAKNPFIPPEHSVNLTKENTLQNNSSRDCIVKNETVANRENNDKLNDELDKSERVELTIDILRNKAIDNKSGSSLTGKKSDKNKEIQESNDNSRKNQITHNSMKITDILPTLAQFDKILSTKNSEDPLQDKLLSDDTSLFERTPRIFKQAKSFNRKKLYTARNSPIDIIVSALNNKKKLSFKTNVHPALSTPTIKRNTLFSRRRTSWFQKRRKKRFSQLADAIKNSENAAKIEEDNRTESHNGDGNLLKALELTRSNGTIRRRKIKRATIAEKSSIKDIRQKHTLDHTCYDSDVPQNKIESYVSNSEKSQSDKKLQSLIELCSLKNLKILLERYVEKNSSTNETSNQSVTHKKLPKSSPSSRKKSTNNIHELDQESQESDQSTILIYKCANDHEKNSGCDSESQIKSQQKHINQSNDNIGVSAGEEKKIYETNQSSVIIRSTSLTELDEDNSTSMSSPRFQQRFQAYSANSIINFSSDEEDDFFQIIRENAGKHAEKSNIITSTSDQTFNSIEDNCENLIKDLTDQSAEEPKGTPVYATEINLVIVESDEEEMINSQKSILRTKKGTIKRQVETTHDPSVKTRSMSKSSNIISTNKQTDKNTISRVLRYHSSSDSSASNEYNVTPTKRLKLIPDIESETLKNNGTRKSRRISEEFSLNAKVSRWNNCKWKTRVHFANERNEILSKNRMNRKSRISSTLAEQSDTIFKDVRVSLEKLRPLERLTSSCPSSTYAEINEEEKSIRCNDDIGINRHAKMKLRTRNSSKSQRLTIDNQLISHTHSSSRSAKINSVKLNDTSSDNEKSFSGNKNARRLSSLEKSYGDKIRNSQRQPIFPNLFDDSSSDCSLNFNSRGRSQRANMNNLLKSKTMTFRTRSDDSDASDSDK